MAHLGPSAIPTSLFREILDVPETTLLCQSIGKHLAELRRLSLIDINTEHHHYVHRLISSFVRHISKDNINCRSRVLNFINQKISLSWNENYTQKMQELEIVLPHADAILNQKNDSNTFLSELANNIGKHHQNYGRLNDALLFYEKAENFSDKALLPYKVAEYKSNQAIMLRDLGSIQKAIDLLKQALDIFQQDIKSNELHIALTQSRLATVLELQYKYTLNKDHLKIAKNLLYKAIAVFKQHFPQNHPNVIGCRSNLVGVLNSLGEQSEEYKLRDILTESEKKLPLNPFEIASHQTNLGLALNRLREYEEAEYLLRKALTTVEHNFPNNPNHLFIARCKMNLAEALHYQGRNKDACDLVQQAVDSKKIHLPLNHPDILKGEIFLEVLKNLIK